jgi:HK97 family phage prohead protease
MEKKFIDLRELKMKESGPGEIEGYRAVHSVIDEGGDILIPGAFKDCIDEYLASGFTAHSHVWSFSEAIGFPVKAYEDSHGFFVVSRFHSTADAQDIRTKAKERLAAGKTVGFSFGYSVDAYDHIQRSAYKTELPKYLRPSSLSENMRKAERFPQLRLLKRVSVMEDSLVTSPMNKLAIATAAKAGRRAQGMTTGMARLRSESLRLRNKALCTLYGVEDLKNSSDLRRESERIRAEAQRTLLNLDLAISKARYRRTR